MRLNCKSLASAILGLIVIVVSVLLYTLTGGREITYGYAILLTGQNMEVVQVNLALANAQLLGECKDGYTCANKVTTSLPNDHTDQVVVLSGLMEDSQDNNNLRKRQQLTNLMKTLNGTNQVLQKVDQSFSVKKPNIITNTQQAIYEWITANIQLNQVANSGLKSPTVGLISMDRKSSKICYENNQTDSTVSGKSVLLGLGGDQPNNLTTLIELDSRGVKPPTLAIKLNGHKYSLTATVNNCFGTEAALKRLYLYAILKSSLNNSDEITHADPCAAKASITEVSGQDLAADPCLQLTPSLTKYLRKDVNYTFIGKPNLTQCRKHVNQILDTEICKFFFEICFQQPERHPPSSMTYVISGAYEEVLGPILNNTGSISKEKRDTVIGQWCNNATDNNNSNNLTTGAHNCFTANYVINSLRKMYDFESVPRLVSSPNSSPLDWTIGYLASAFDNLKFVKRVEPIFGSWSLAFFSLIGFLFLAYGLANLTVMVDNEEEEGEAVVKIGYERFEIDKESR